MNTLHILLLTDQEINARYVLVMVLLSLALGTVLDILFFKKRKRA